jgi:Na+/proline symporter
MKAVVWTDTFQVLIMYIGLLSIIIQGSLKVGGFKVIFDRAYMTDRLKLFK